MQLNLIACIGLLLLGCSGRQAKIKETLFAGSIYQVKEGDTVHNIAKKKQVSVFDLMEINGIVDSGQLRKGQRLYIPEPILKPAESSLRAAAKGRVAIQESKERVKVNGKKIALAWPLKNGVLFKGFNLNPKQLHEGIALGAPKGTPVQAAAHGEIIYVGDDEARYGRIVIINHEDSFVTIYAHLAQIHVSKGQKVKQHDPIGTVGVSGGVDSPRVYFQVRKHRIPVDPELYLTP